MFPKEGNRTGPPSHPRGAKAPSGPGRSSSPPGGRPAPAGQRSSMPGRRRVVIRRRPALVGREPSGWGHHPLSRGGCLCRGAVGRWIGANDGPHRRIAGPHVATFGPRGTDIISHGASFIPLGQGLALFFSIFVSDRAGAISRPRHSGPRRASSAPTEPWCFPHKRSFRSHKSESCPGSAASAPIPCAMREALSPSKKFRAGMGQRNQPPSSTTCPSSGPGGGLEGSGPPGPASRSPGHPGSRPGATNGRPMGRRWSDSAQTRLSVPQDSHF